MSVVIPPDRKAKIRRQHAQARALAHQLIFAVAKINGIPMTETKARTLTGRVSRRALAIVVENNK